MSIAVSLSSPSYQEQAAQLAASQTISAAPDVRYILTEAMACSNYATPEEQAWFNLASSLSAGDLAAADRALDSYTQMLPSSPQSMSSMTTPSATFLGDLDTVRNAIESGDLGTARTAFQTAQYDAPDNVLGAWSLATAMHDVDQQARLMMEASANIAGYLVSIGYSQPDAAVEANDILLGSFTETEAPLTMQEKLQQAEAQTETEMIAALESQTAPETNQLAATGASAMYEVYASILGAASSTDTSTGAYALRDAALRADYEALTAQSVPVQVPA